MEGDMKKLFSRICFTTILLTLATCSNTPYQYRQVLTIAPHTDSYTLKVDDHIRYAARPDDPYSYPIPMGEIGPVNSVYAGGNRYPFACSTSSSGLGQPEVDNQELLGTPVFKTDDMGKLTRKVIGFSKDCSVKTQLRLFVVTKDNEIKETFVDQLSLLKSDDLLLRVEQGTINRHIYTLVMPITSQEVHYRSSKKLWNERLIYQFAGGVGIGFRQGKINPKKLLSRRSEQLREGYAVISSSANKTSYTYNMLLAEDTAWRVKRQFISLYGEPIYTVGIGGSGGGLAQYLIAQNSPGLIDAALPLYSYPDMVSQTIYALDCDLFNSYYAFKSNLENWDLADKKRSLEGLNNANIEHKSWFYYPVNQLLSGKKPYIPKNYSECIHGYFGLSALINNPAQGFLKPIFSPDVKRKTHWSYWQDLAPVFGEGQKGYANSLWGNRGVQYGLNGLKQNLITIDEFLDLNYRIGSWKPAESMQQEQLLYFPFVKIPIWLTQWSRHNITTPDSGPAKRASASIHAVQQAYRYGQVFLGYNDIPTIDIHHYLEEELDMHHISTAFATRLRIENKMGTSDNHKIWISHKDYTPLKEAFSAIDHWLLNNQEPENASDRCFDGSGQVIAFGKQVWNGAWNQRSNGDCTTTYPIYTNSRIQAGGPWSGSIFECNLMPIEDAIKNGVYAPLDMTPHIQELRNIFPDGVCDYSKGDKGFPSELIDKSTKSLMMPSLKAK